MKYTAEEVRSKIKDLKDWRIQGHQLYFARDFKDFKTAFSVMVRIAFEAENMGHHPEWKNVYNHLEINLTTHDEGGITDKDIKLARLISGITQ